ncbi:heparinase II/III family protein [Silvibacterium dinghuense]|nr:heparinase II/III family protein [Silvibacterium dinghuense]GGH17344.1 hypothetical protein GCM10011586_39810 [Silvibacterium dinghuense]
MKQMLHGMGAWVLLFVAVTAFAQGVQLSSERVQQIAAMLPAAARGLDVPCSNRGIWAPRAAQLQDQIQQADSLIAEPLPAWSDEAYLDFSRTGQRPRGEAMLHARQDRLASLTMAECAQWKGRYLQALTALLDGLAEQPTWTLPAHDADLSSFHREHYRVELNSAVLADDLAEALYLLGNAIPHATQDRVRMAILERTIQPAREIYLNRSKEFWVSGATNWNAVCLDGVTGAALMTLSSSKDRAWFTAVAEKYSRNYLRSFTPEGYAIEGIGYWGYGFTHYALLREMLWNQTGGGIDLFRSQQVRNIALFGRRFQMIPGVMADFGDAHFGVKPNNSLIAYVDHAYSLGTQSLENPFSFGRPLLGQSLVAQITAWHLAPPLQRFDTATLDVDPLRDYFPGAGVLVSRPGAQGGVAITIKGGGNGGHSHNDLGAFSVGLGTEQVLGDPGGPEAYNANTFSSRRFDSKLLNSYGHPVPVIGGQLQKDATSITLRGPETHFTGAEDTWMLDLSEAYAVPALHDFTRTMKHTRAGKGNIEIVDRFSLSTPTTVEESLPTHGQVKQLDAHTLLFTMHGESVRVTIEASAPITIRQETIDEYGNPFLRVGISALLQGHAAFDMIIEPEP